MSGPNVETGFYAIEITLDDGRNQVSETVIVDVRDPVPIEEETEELEEDETPDEQPQSASTTVIDETSVESTAEEEVELTAQEETDLSVFDWRQAFMDLDSKRNRTDGDFGVIKPPVPHLALIE